MAQQKIKYAARQTVTITLASLGTNADRNQFAIGRESTAISNTSTLYDDVLVTGQVTTGTSPISGRPIRAFVYASMTDTPTYPDVLTGTDANCTLTQGVVRAGQYLTIDGTSNRAYFFHFSVAGLYGGIMPKHWGIFFSNSSGVNLNSTGSNHYFKYQGITYQTAT